MSFNFIAQNLKSIKEQIEFIQQNNQQVKLIAVSKTKPIEAIKTAYQFGQTDFAENYPQELATKATELKQLNINWHFIGQIQSNKTKLIAEHCHWVHSLSSLKIAQRLNHHSKEKRKILKVLIQVNLLSEEQKSGVLGDELNDLVAQISELQSLELRGLMFIPPINLTKSELKNAFETIVKINQKLKMNFPQFNLDTLSFGMSADWKIAIETGSNCIRIGTAIFGKR